MTSTTPIDPATGLPALPENFTWYIGNNNSVHVVENQPDSDWAETRYDSEAEGPQSHHWHGESQWWTRELRWVTVVRRNWLGINRKVNVKEYRHVDIRKTAKSHTFKTPTDKGNVAKRTQIVYDIFISEWEQKSLAGHYPPKSL